MAVLPGVVTRSSGYPKSGGGPYEIYWQAMPTSLTDMDTRDSRLTGFVAYNSTGAPITLTLQTKDATPIPLAFSGALAAGVTLVANSPFEMLCKGGWSVQASATGVYFGAVWSH